MNLHNHQLTIGQLIEQAEQSSDEQFHMSHLSLNDDGRELILAVVVGKNLDHIAAILEGLRMMSLEHARLRADTSLEYPMGTTVKLRHNYNDACVGWAHRGENGELLSAYGRHPLDPDAWVVIEEKDAR